MLGLLENTRSDAMIGVRALRAGTICSPSLGASTRNACRKLYSSLSPNIPLGEKKPWLLRKGCGTWALQKRALRATCGLLVS